MSQGVEVVGLYVRDQDEAVEFYVGKLGFRVHTDVKNGGYRWLTVQHPEQPSFQLGLFRPQEPVLDSASAAALAELVAKGAMPPLVLVVDDCRGLRADARRGRRADAGAGRPLRHGRRRLPRSVGERLEGDPGAEGEMSASRFVRQSHRGVSMLFTATVVANFAAMAAGYRPPPPWITYAPLLPLFLLFASGLWLFALPYVVRRRERRAGIDGSS